MAQQSRASQYLAHYRRSSNKPNNDRGTSQLGTVPTEYPTEPAVIRKENGRVHYAGTTWFGDNVPQWVKKLKG